MKLALATTLATTCLAVAPKGRQLTNDYSYERYLADHNKKQSEEGEILFISNIRRILEHNANPNRAKASEGSCVHVVLATAGAGHLLHAGPFARGVVHGIVASPNGPNRAPKPSPELAD